MSFIINSFNTTTVVPFSSVVLLLHADGTNGSTTFTDSSSYAHASSAIGNAQLSTALSKFGSASMLFDGTGDQVTYASASEYNLGGNDFTINFWFYSTNSTQVNRRLVCRQANTAPTNSTSEYTIANSSLGGIYATVYSGGVNYTVGAEAWSRYGDSAWHFVELTRAGGVFTFRIDGVIIGRATQAITLQNGVWATRIGSIETAANQCFDGYIDELRLINGSAVVHRTNPVAAFSNFSVEASDTGSDVVDSLYSSVLLHVTMEGQGTTTAFTDCSTYFRPLTKVGNVQYDTSVKPFGFSSGAFDGASDYITVPDSDDWLFVNGDFTFECMLYLNSNPAAGSTLASQFSTLNNKSWQFRVTPSTMQFFFSTDGTTNQSLSFSWTASLTTWYHVAIVRQGTNLMMFIDGTQQDTTKTLSTTSIANSTLPMCIGASGIGGAGEYSPLNGKMKSLRITAAARYTGSFPTPTDLFPRSS